MVLTVQELGFAQLRGRAVTMPAGEEACREEAFRAKGPPQYEALKLWPADSEAADRMRRTFLKSQQVPEEQMRYAALRSVAQEYLRERWREVWECRERASRRVSGGGAVGAWGRYAALERKLWESAGKLKLPAESLLPPAGATEEAERLLAAPMPESHDEAEAVLAKALLAPGEAAIAEKAFAFCCRMPKPKLPCRLPQQCEPQWGRVAMAPDPRVKEALVKFVCTPDGLPHAGAICYYLLVSKSFGEHWPLSDAETRNLVACAPEGVLAEAIRLAGLGGAGNKAVLKEMATDPGTSAALRVALASVFASDRDFAKRLFEAPADPALDGVRLQVLRAYADSGAIPSPGIDIAKWASGADLSPEMKRAIVPVLGRVAWDRVTPRGRNAMLWLEQASQDPADKELAQAAKAALDSAEKVVSDVREDRASEWREWQENCREQIRLRRERLTGSGDGKNILSDADRANLQSELTELVFSAESRGIRECQRSVGMYYTVNGHVPPKSTGDLSEYLPPQVWEHAVFLPIGETKPGKAPKRIVLAFMRRAAVSPARGERVVVVVFPDGEGRQLTQSEFSQVWAASNEERVKLGLPPIQLGSPEAPDPWRQ